MLENLTVLTNYSQAKFDESVFENTKIIETAEGKQFLYIWGKKLASAELSINVRISLNSYNLPGDHDKKLVINSVMAAFIMIKFPGVGKNR